MKKVVVIGGNAAGMSAASQVKRQQPSWEVVVYEKGPYISYAACGIPYYVQGLVPTLEGLISVTPAEAVSKRKINLRLKQTVTAIDPQAKSVTVRDEESEFKDHYDYLLIATGTRPQKAGIDYAPSRRISHALTLADAYALRSFIDAQKPRKCAVIGGGYIAVEMLEALRDRGLETHLVHRRDALSRNFEKELSDQALAAMEKQGIVLQLNREVLRLTEQDNRVTVHTGHETLIYDLVVVATGVEAESSLAKQCGVETGIKDAIRVNELMQTNLPYIYAAGDCAETKQIITGRPLYLALALKANKEGVVAGVNISGGRDRFPGVLGTAITKFFDLGLARTGLTLAEAENEGFSALKIEVASNSKAHYYPGAGTLTSILIADQKEGRLLGAQLAGPADSIKRIDVYVAAITAGMNLDQLFQLDLAYAPPFSPVYDPVVLAGRVGRKLIESE